MADDKRRRRRSSWEDLFGTFDEDFEEMRRRMDLLMEQFMRGDIETIGQPMIYGFSMRVGPDGKPRIQEFGNAVPPETSEEAGGREPLTDIIEEKDSVRVIVELPGVEKDDIQLNAEDAHLEVEVDREDRRFYKKLELPCSVDPDSAQASYKNGVLEVTLTRVVPKKKGRAVKIEEK